MKYAENKTFALAKPGEVIKYLESRERTVKAFSPSSLQLILDNEMPLLETRNGTVLHHPVRKSFCHKLLRWYLFPLNQLKKLSDETVISICNDYLRKFTAEKVNVIFDNDDAITVTSTNYTDIPDLTLLRLAENLKIAKVSKDDFILRIYGEEIVKKEPIVNDPCGFSFNIISSDTGFRTIFLTHYVLRYSCTNGAVLPIGGTNRNKISHVNNGKTEILELLETQISQMKSEFDAVSKAIAKMTHESADSYVKKIKAQILPSWGRAFTKDFFSEWDKETETGRAQTKYDLYNFITEKAKKHNLVHRFYFEELAGKLISEKFSRINN
jgi:hypothetical protein